MQPLCPACRAATLEQARGDATQGLLQCPRCGSEHPVLDGLPLLMHPVRPYVARNLYQIVERTDLDPAVDALLGDCCGPDSAWGLTRDQLSTWVADPWLNAGPLPLLEAALQMQPELEGPILDLGCGSARSTKALAERFPDAEVIGIDLNFAIMKAARSLLDTGRLDVPRRRYGVVYDRVDLEIAPRSQLPLWIADASRVPVADASAGAVVCLNLLDSVDDPLGLLQEMARVVRPGGFVLLATPFDWVASTTPIERWIGGHSSRAPTQGHPARMMESYLAREDVCLDLVDARADVPWTVQAHAGKQTTWRCWVAVLSRNRSA